ncbi:MAG: 4'-phosphopantetheinyl transferase superfamily protein [Chlamydiia bacterium]|nr:4'-phosphopantetheinyl transferase superfamily protein [Chlamydiia bacterium]
MSKRQRSYIGGRLCAEACCRALGVDSPDIASDSLGRPQWPPGLVGSITHSEQLAVAAVASNTKLAGLGIDSETMTSNRDVLAAIQDIVLIDEEHQLVREGRDLILLFSLKEACFKALNPLCDISMDFRGIHVISLDRGEGSARVGVPSIGFEGTGLFTFDDASGHVHSYVAVP